MRQRMLRLPVMPLLTRQLLLPLLATSFAIARKPKMLQAKTTGSIDFLSPPCSGSDVATMLRQCAPLAHCQSTVTGYMLRVSIVGVEGYGL